MALILVAWGQSAIWGPRNIQEFVTAKALDGVTRETMLVDDAAEAAELAKRGIDAPHWLYVGNARSPFPLIVSVDVDVLHSDIWWSPRRLYFFWCCGMHPQEPFYEALLDDEV